MRNQIKENTEFNILSRSIDNAVKCRVIEISEDCFKVKLDKLKKYEPEESVELFTMTNKGQLYFETFVKEAAEDVISIWFPISYKYLQRREYSRINVDKDIVLNDGQNDIKAKISDLSAGGLKVITAAQLQLLKEYEISIKIENRELKIIFEPIRIETVNNDFISSGRFKDISNFDRIALVQYCFRKQIENSNK